MRELHHDDRQPVPEPAAGRRGHRADRHRATSPAARPRKLSGGQTQRVRFAHGAGQQPRPAGARRADGRDGRRGAARLLGDDAAPSRAGGKTVVFATHYLEEADAYADRIILMARGRIVADGPATEIKATVGLRTIRATLPERRPDALARAARRHQRRHPRRGRDPELHRLRRRAARPAAGLPRRARHRGHRRRPGRGVPATDRRRRRGSD